MIDEPALAPRLTTCDGLLRSGRLEEAIESIRRVVEVDPGNSTSRSLLVRAIALRQKRDVELVARKDTHGYAVVRCLGIGRGGCVYLAQNSGGTNRIVKVFHPHHLGPINDDTHDSTGKAVPGYREVLIRLSKSLKACTPQSVDPLYQFDLLEHDGRIEGFVYQYEPLIRIRRRYLALPDVAMSIVGAFLRMQACLSQQAGVYDVDAHLANFMLTRTGRPRYVDYGRSFIPADDPRCAEEHQELRALIRLLYQLFNPSQARSFDGRHFDVVLGEKAGFRSMARTEGWLATILSTIDTGHLESFLDAGYYRDLSKMLPQRVRAASQAVIVLADTIGGLKRHLATRRITGQAA